MERIKAVLVTGASTGIGRRVTERLAAEGYFVYAGVRKDSDLRALGVIKNVEALRLDVRSSDDIAAAIDAVAAGGRGLYGLVNNAGVFTLGPVVNGNDREFDLVMAVNIRGVCRITKAFAPMVIHEQGRIVMMGAVSGILAVKNASAYSMSKHALEALTDSLAAEVEPLGVQVSIIEPGGFNSEIGKHAVERMGENHGLPDFSKFEEPDAVVSAVVLALFESKPKRRYLVVSDEDSARRTIEKQIAQLVQLNERHRYTYDRDSLIQMLDDALAQCAHQSRVFSERVQAGQIQIVSEQQDSGNPMYAV
jgi:NAD(P)-dependent dehydrogenase (short-subunit alcohol dehydrogenase family)